ncbi:DUF2934 domain-containing protein [Pseudomonadota bacterium]
MTTKQTAVKKSPKIPRKPVKTASQKRTPLFTEDDRRRMIAEAAYYQAERRNFTGGDINEDWYLAEAEIDATLSKKKPH